MIDNLYHEKYMVVHHAKSYTGNEQCEQYHKTIETQILAKNPHGFGLSNSFLSFSISLMAFDIRSLKKNNPAFLRNR